MVDSKCELIGMFAGKTLMKWSRNSSTFFAGQLTWVLFDRIGVPSGDRLEPLPIMDLVKDHSRGCS